ncbi:hypothetical protein [Butyrivibrio sp. VCB2006]|uniref:hypothetical protein n=1 Tax=Butyrivibrio sp. VCB2006 TaxID=1280679 RepID=UPI0003FA8A88|nr:hypothetical protein [Butyrivibrio sp. VCB2006]
MSKYNDIMNKIEVTEEMRSRILQNIAKEFDEPKGTDLDNSQTDDAIKDVQDVTEFTVNNTASANNNVRSFQPKGGLYNFTKYAGLAAAAVILLVGATVVFGPKEKGAMETASMSDIAISVAQEAAADMHHEAELIKSSWVKYDSVEQLSSVAKAEFTDIEYLSSISSEVDYYLDNCDTATIVYDVTGNQITVSEASVVTEMTEESVMEAAEEPAMATDAGTAHNILGGGIAGADKAGKTKTVADTFTVGDTQINVYGTEDGFNRASWTVGDIEYTLESVEKISLDEMTELMTNILSF